MKIIIAIITSLVLLTGCAIKDPTLKDVDCTGYFQLQTTGRTYTVDLIKEREGKTGKSYYTYDKAFSSSWVSPSQFEKIECRK